MIIYPFVDYNTTTIITNSEEYNVIFNENSDINKTKQILKMVLVQNTTYDSSYKIYYVPQPLEGEIEEQYVLYNGLFVSSLQTTTLTTLEGLVLKPNANLIFSVDDTRAKATIVVTYCTFNNSNFEPLPENNEQSSNEQSNNVDSQTTEPTEP